MKNLYKNLKTIFRVLKEGFNQEFSTDENDINILRADTLFELALVAAREEKSLNVSVEVKEIYFGRDITETSPLFSLILQKHIKEEFSEESSFVQAAINCIHYDQAKRIVEIQFNEHFMEINYCNNFKYFPYFRYSN